MSIKFEIFLENNNHVITLTAKCTKNHLYYPKNVSYISRLHVFALSS